jgi:hypothetical protein
MAEAIKYTHHIKGDVHGDRILTITREEGI